jgi:hypothetical protein
MLGRVAGPGFKNVSGWRFKMVLGRVFCTLDAEKSSPRASRRAKKSENTPKTYEHARRCTLFEFWTSEVTLRPSNTSSRPNLTTPGRADRCGGR